MTLGTWTCELWARYSSHRSWERPWYRTKVHDGTQEGRAERAVERPLLDRPPHPHTPEGASFVFAMVWPLARLLPQATVPNALVVEMLSAIAAYSSA